MTKREFLSMSLGTDLKCLFTGIRCPYTSQLYTSEFESFKPCKFYPILRPITELKSDKSKVFIQKAMNIKNNGDWIHLMANDIKIDEIPFYLIQLLISYHFDIAFLIEKGEAMDYNEIDGFEDYNIN